MNNAASTEPTSNATLPQLLDFHQLEEHFGISRTTAYLLASSGDLPSLTIGAPKKRGKRVFHLPSVLNYIAKRTAYSKPLNCKPGTGKRKTPRS